MLPIRPIVPYAITLTCALCGTTDRYPYSHPIDRPRAVAAIRLRWRGLPTRCPKCGCENIERSEVMA